MAQTISYNLDSLGWMQFEQLIQVLLKSELGVGVEVWGGSADHGKDAYCAHDLNFPSKHVTNPGPFVFQAKFIAGANAAGAEFESQLFAAVKKEAALIQNRVEAGKWKTPRQYGFFTNVPLSANQRSTVLDLLQPVLGDCVVSSQGATDVCALLDSNITVARSCPQVLSLRNLFEILDQVVRNEIVQRSDAVIIEAESLANVFVPTRAYEEAWQVLEKHNFVVLEGPPEMGKTAIAWMVAAVMLAEKWQAVDCDKPADFFAAYSNDRQQIFIADDAFGTTEYDVGRGSEWARQMHKIIPKLNKRHWLVWTSRMTILQQALQEMSLQGSAAKFPDEKEVLVKAAHLEMDERALMLYRHARAAQLEAGAKDIVRNHAKEIVDNDHFTPERIRRFVREALPQLQSQLSSDGLDEDQLASAVIEAIENPTDRMRKSYRLLDEEKRSILISLLDCERSPSIGNLEEACKRLHAPKRPIQEEVALLKEGFLQESTASSSYRASSGGYEKGVDWIHPSYRDLVIEELERDAPASRNFLEKCSWIGLQLTLSIAGGEKGLRRYPLMASDESWSILRRRLVALLEETSSPYELRQVVQSIRGSFDGINKENDAHKNLALIIQACCDTLRHRINSHPHLMNVYLLEEYYELTMTIAPPPPMPNVYALWKQLQSKFELMLNKAEDGHLLNEETLADWAKVTGIVVKTDRRILYQDGYPSRYEALMEQLIDAARSESENVTASDDEVASSESDRLTSVAMGLRSLISVFSTLESGFESAAWDVETRASRIRADIRKTPDSDSPSWSSSRSVKADAAIALDRLFSDL